MYYSRKTRQSRSSDFIVRITTCTGTRWEGKIEHVQSGQHQYFYSITELILLMNRKLNAVDFPQSGTKLRTWYKEYFVADHKEGE